MNEELKNQLLSMLTGLTEAAKSGAAFAGQQIPILVQEKIAFGRAYETSCLICAIIVCFLSYKLVLFGHKKYVAGKAASTGYNDDGYMGWIFVIVTGAIGILGSGIAFIANIETVLKVWFAPHLYIVDWLIELSNTAAGK